MITAMAIHTPALQRLYDDWERRRRGRTFPARADFDVLDLKYMIGNLVLVDVLYDPLRFRFRLHGSRVGQRVGYDMTGKDVGQLPPGLSALARRHFTTVVETRAPRVEIRERQIADQGIVDSEVLVLPLSHDGNCIDMLMVGVCFP
jgi:hypothetical protein